MNKHEARQELGRRIRFLRREQKLSLRKFALMVDLSCDYIVDIEHARKSPSFTALLKISDGLGITLADLVEGIDSQKR